LAVAIAQAYMTQQQVRLTQVQARLANQWAQHRELETRVAELSNPAHVVRAAQKQGLTVPAQVTDLTQVTVPGLSTVPRSPSTTTPAHRGARPRASGAGGT
jgi:hypothetical protein